MTQEQIMDLQRHVGAYPDGFWGPESVRRTRAHLTALMPKPHPWPKSDRASIERFFGQPGDESNLVLIDLPYPMKYGVHTVNRTRCHKLVADSLLRVLESIRLLMPAVPSIADEATDYGGIYNYRPKRGSTSLSLHSWGIAIDLDADDNTFRRHWPLEADMPIEIMECFAREGWLAAGAFWNYDAMHFQATQP